MRRLIISLLIMSALLPVALVAQTNIFFDAENEPFMYELDKMPAGLYPALIGEAFKRMGVKTNIQTLPWKRVIDGCDKGTNGVGGLYMNSERLLKYDYSKPLFDETLIVYTLKSKDFKFSTINDLFGKTVGVHRGWTYGDEFDAAVAANKLKKDDVSSDEANLKKLAVGYVDAVIANPQAADAILTKLGITSSITKQQTLFSTISVYLAFNKSVKMTDTLAKFDTTIAAMKKDGSYDKIIASVLGK